MKDSVEENIIQDTANVNCRVLLDVMIAQGVETIVLSPGSRNTPILIGASARRKLHKIIISDERTAAFVALGIAMTSRRPVALACTSGTALYNYAPAVAEAFYQKIPLIVLTADRPSQWIGQDDSQTLRQFGALDNIVKRSYDLYTENGMSLACANPEYESEREWSVNRIANEALITATTGIPGPVHINMQFAEPLGSTIEYTPEDVRKIEVFDSDNGLKPHVCRELAETMMNRRVMVVAGFMTADNKLNRSLQRFTKLGNVTLLCETISNLHLEGHPHMIDSILAGLSQEQKDDLRPDLVISIGGSLVSRMLKEYLRKSPGLEHWTLGDTDVSVDCFQRLTGHIDVSPERFFTSVGGMMTHLLRKGGKLKYPDYSQKWDDERKRVHERDTLRLENKKDWSELKALDKIFKTLPSNYNLFLSNGTCVRYAQLLLDKMPHGCYCNRGVSGIDGTNATALGVAVEYDGTTLLVTGDMSFAYNPEILNLKNLGGDLRIIVINNGGGGIFRFIRTTRNLPIREEYFCADPQLPIENITRAYGWNYHRADNLKSLESALENLYSTPHTLIEVTVDAESSSEQLINWLENNYLKK